MVKVLEVYADRIDEQKLRVCELCERKDLLSCSLTQAIGLRMTCENEVDQRNRQRRALQALINEKKAELDRHVAQSQSLERIEAEQVVQLEKLNCVQSN